MTTPRPAVFVSYRQSDCGQEAQRIRTLLQARWGEGVVFVDKESLQPGEPWEVPTRQALSTACVVLALIGPDWLMAKNQVGNRRLMARDDWVREELVYALSNKVTFVVALFRDAEMPSKEALPIELTELLEPNAFRVSESMFELDVHKLAGFIENLVVTKYDSRTLRRRMLLNRLIFGLLARSNLRQFLMIFVSIVLGVLIWLWRHN